jgi:hypothetical protein
MLDTLKPSLDARQDHHGHIRARRTAVHGARWRAKKKALAAMNAMLKMNKLVIADLQRAFDEA